MSTCPDVENENRQLGTETCRVESGTHELATSTFRDVENRNQQLGTGTCWVVDNEHPKFATGPCRGWTSKRRVEM
jgi:hypothetical protein